MKNTLRFLELMFLCFVSSAESSRLLGDNTPSTWPKESRVLQLRTAVLRNDSPPSYMIHLYNRYRKGRMPYSTANTVRSFYPISGRLGNDDLLVFNLTGVHASEYVERVDLHLHSKRHLRTSTRLDPKRPGLEVDLLDLSRPLRPKIETISLARVQSGGWQTLDLTDSVIACLESDSEQHHLVGVIIRGRDVDGLADVTKAVSQPFLVLFSEDDDHLRIEELDRRKDNRQAIIAKREILDNELPDYPMDNSARAEVQARLKYRPLDTAVAKPEARTVAKSASGALEKHRKRRRRRRRKDRRLPHPWGKGWWGDGDGPGDDDEDDDENDAPSLEAACHKKSLAVDFGEIGWGGFVIAPKTFDTSFCAGECPYPLMKDLEPSNHATLQGLLRFLGGAPAAVPGLCCVPRTLSPLTVLFHDENRNVVLKNFPDMSVDTCTCR